MLQLNVMPSSLSKSYKKDFRFYISLIVAIISFLKYIITFTQDSSTIKKNLIRTVIQYYLNLIKDNVF